MPYRCDFYSDEEFQQACMMAEEQEKERLAFEQYQEECAYEEYLQSSTNTNKNN